MFRVFLSLRYFSFEEEGEVFEKLESLRLLLREIVEKWVRTELRNELARIEGGVWKGFDGNYIGWTVS